MIFKNLNIFFKDFKTKYAANWNKYFNKETSDFDVLETFLICDGFLSNYLEKKEMKEFKEKSGIDFEVS